MAIKLQEERAGDDHVRLTFTYGKDDVEAALAQWGDAGWYEVDRFVAPESYLRRFAWVLLRRARGVDRAQYPAAWGAGCGTEMHLPLASGDPHPRPMGVVR